VPAVRAWDQPVQAVLAAVALACTGGVIAARRRLTAVVSAAGAGYAVTGLFVLHGAPDLALTLLLVETLSLVILVLLLRRQPTRFPRPARAARPRLRAAATATLAGACATLLATLLLLATSARRWPPLTPDFADLAAGSGADNLVNLILSDVRALDTLGEICVLTVAALGVVNLVAPASIRPDRRPAGATAADRIEPPLGERSVALELTVRVLVPPILVFALYLLLAGHNRPGGGFVAGLVAGTAFVLRYIAGGVRELRAAWPWPATPLLGGGLALAVVTGATGWIGGGQFLESAHLTVHLSALGELEVSSTLAFETAIAVLVLGLVLNLLHQLGAAVGEGDSDPSPGRVGGTEKAG
jgi:multicomponent Na+:H+ antiporter subunit A